MQTKGIIARVIAHHQPILPYVNVERLAQDIIHTLQKQGYDITERRPGA